VLDKKRSIIAGPYDKVFRESTRHMKSIVFLLAPLYLTNQKVEKTEINTESWKKTVALWREGTEDGYSTPHLEADENDYRLLIQNIESLIGFRTDENLIPIFIDGAVENITGYGEEDFLSCRIGWLEIVIDEDQPLIFENIEKALSNPADSVELEYRIRSRDGKIKWVRHIIQKTPACSGKSGEIQGFVRDITRHKLAEISLKKIEKVRMKEINHRLKNNLQVISSLLSLEAEKFTDPKILEAFRESQNRIASMSLIHQELYTREIDTIDFTSYLQKLIEGVFSSYRVRKDKVSLRLELEQVFMEANTAIALGIIVNELVSNALKYAFPAGKEGEIRIRLSQVKGYKKEPENYGNPGPIPGCLKEKNLPFILTIEDNGTGIPEYVDFRKTDSLGLQLVNTFVEQIEGSIELERDRGTKFSIHFDKPK
jgi:PAS domain S-box-containing protein